MHQAYQTDQGLAAALLSYNYSLLTTYDGEDGKERYVFYYDDEAEDLYWEVIRAYYDGTLKVSAKDFRRYEQKLADGSLVEERFGQTITHPGPSTMAKS
jgi:hypothetical protein